VGKVNLVQEHVMRRTVKWIKQRKNGKTYSQPWIGYNYRNKNGTPDFCREISLKALSKEQVDKIDASLRNKIAPSDAVGTVQFLDSAEIGGFWAAYCIADKLGIINAISKFDEKHQYAILCMILDRVVSPLPHSKLALWESLPGSVLSRVAAPDGMEVKLHDMYQSLEHLFGSQQEIQQALYKGSRSTDSMYLYDITSSYFEGNSCELAEYGYNRDGKKGKMQIVIGLLADSAGRPLAIEVFKGNTNDQSTVMDRIDSMRQDFGIKDLVFIGDRGMITRTRREDLQAEEYSAVKYISALKRKEFFDFLEDQNHPLQLTLFDREKLVEVSYDGIRYVLSFNPEKEEEDHLTRIRLLEKTYEKMAMIERNVKNGRLKKEKAIAKKIHRWINKWNMERFFDYDYSHGVFNFSRNDEKIKGYEAIDGFYVIISDIIDPEIDTAELRYRYKSLIQVEQAFRTMKSTDIFVRPIRHWNADRVRGHVFLCMLSYLIIWEARQLFKEFIAKEPVSEEYLQHDCHSLRIIWERLTRGVKIGKISINGKITEQLSPVTTETKKMLAAAHATLNQKCLDKLLNVG